MGRFDKFGADSTNLPTVQGGASVPDKAELREAYAKKGKLVGRQEALKTALNSPAGEFAICLDATGSMADLIEDAKASIRTIIDRVTTHAGTKIKLQLFAYRDYDAGSDVLEASPLSSDANELVAWLGRITARGGGANQGEAVEQALQAIAKAGNFTGVIVAGDEPPNPRDELDAHGHRSQPSAFELAKGFAAKRIPIHTFVVGEDRRTVRDFKKLSDDSGGQSGRLDGSSEMIDMAIMAILASLRGAVAVKAYADAQQLTQNAREFGRLLIEAPKKR